MHLSTFGVNEAKMARPPTLRPNLTHSLSAAELAEPASTGPPCEVDLMETCTPDDAGTVNPHSHAAIRAFGCRRSPGGRVSRISRRRTMAPYAGRRGISLLRLARPKT
jgi:hypothetical protein